MESFPACEPVASSCIQNASATLYQPQALFLMMIDIFSKYIFFPSVQLAPPDSFSLNFNVQLPHYGHKNASTSHLVLQALKERDNEGAAEAKAACWSLVAGHLAALNQL